VNAFAATSMLAEAATTASRVITDFPSVEVCTGAVGCVHQELCLAKEPIVTLSVAVFLGMISTFSKEPAAALFSHQFVPTVSFSHD